MHDYSKLPRFDFIQLFADGGEGGGSGEGGAALAATGLNGAAPAQQQTKGAKNPLANVQYGTEVDSAAAQQRVQANDDREAQFDSLIKGDYKDIYEARLKDTLSKRLKGTEDTVNKFNQLSPVLSLLAGKYGVDAGDVEALSKAIEDDETFYEDEALEKGLSVQQVKEMRRMQRENETLKAQMQQRKSQEQANQTYAAWMDEANSLKEIYPSFDLRTELENPTMQRLLLSNVDMRTAFEVVHKDEIIGGAMRYTAGQIAQKVANNVRAGQKRPAEGAMGNKSAVVTKRDVAQLTKADRLEIIRRAERGAQISFD